MKYIKKWIENIFFGRKKFQKFFEYCFKMSLHGMNIGTVADDPKSSGETVVVQYLKNSLSDKKDIVLFDVGANIGKYTSILYDNFQNSAEIYSFEPSKTTYNILKDSISGKDNIHLYNIGFSNKKEKIKLYKDFEGSGIASVYNRNLDHFNIAFDKTEIISVDTVDNFCAKNKIKHIDFMKIDVEGHELKVLEGAMKMIKSNSVRCFQFEIGGTNIDSRTYFHDFFVMFKDQYKIYRIVKDGIYPINEYKVHNECFTTTNYFAELK